MSSKRSLSSLRAGLIGTGFIGPVHLEALRRNGVSVTAVCDATDRARAAARLYAIPEVFGDFDYRAMVRSPRIDVVHITAPNRYHASMALAALKAGKHVVCEKPLAMNSRQTASVVQAAQVSGKVFAVNYNVRFYPAVLQLRHLVARGQLGRIIHVNGSYLQDWLFHPTDYNWRLLPQEGGKLRAVADIGTHWMDAVCFILGGSIAEVLADLATFHSVRYRPVGEVQTFARSTRPVRRVRYPVRTEDFGHVLLRFNNGARGSLAVSQVAAGRKNSIRIEIYGSKQSAWWDSENPEQLLLGQRDRANALAVRNTADFSEGITGYADYPAGHVEGFADTFKMLYRNVYGVIAAGGKGRRFFATPEDGHREVQVCEAILQSHRQQRWVRV